MRCRAIGARCTPIDRLVRSLADERGQDTFEWMLIVGTVTVAMLLATATPLGSALAGQIMTGACLAVKLVLGTMVCS